MRDMALKGGAEMSNCELQATCPFYNDTEQYMFTEEHREQYCRGDYALCGRYMNFFRSRQRELLSEKEYSESSIEKQKVIAVSVTQ